jgi:hypothetical protein
MPVVLHRHDHRAEQHIPLKSMHFALLQTGVQILLHEVSDFHDLDTILMQDIGEWGNTSCDCLLSSLNINKKVRHPDGSKVSPALRFPGRL